MNETYDHIIYFASFTETKNKYGEIEREFKYVSVLADIQELSQFEYTQAAANGLKPEIKFVIAEALEYNGERIINRNEHYYKILQTKKTKDGRGLMFLCEGTVNPWGRSDLDVNAEIGNKT